MQPLNNTLVYISLFVGPYTIWKITDSHHILIQHLILNVSLEFSVYQMSLSSPLNLTYSLLLLSYLHHSPSLTELHSFFSLPGSTVAGPLASSGTNSTQFVCANIRWAIRNVTFEITCHECYFIYFCSSSVALAKMLAGNLWKKNVTITSEYSAINDA